MAIEIGITEPSDFSKKALSLLQGIGKVSEYTQIRKSLQDFVTDKHALFVRLQHYWGRELLQNANKLRYICSPTTGLTHIDMDYAASRGIAVLCLKGETAFLKTISATAEHTFGLGLALLRRYGQSMIRADNFTWDRDRFKGYEIKNMKIGIIGLGRIGIQLCGFFRAFSGDVFYYDIRDDVENPYNAQRTDSITSLVDAVDMIFLCASYEEENNKMINTDVLNRMKGKYFINTSRGEMIDEDALLPLIRRGHFAGVALDVVSGEPGETKAREFATLSGEHNLIITPHISGATYSSMWATEEFIAEKLIDALEHKRGHNC